MDIGRRTLFATLLLGAAPVQAAEVHGGTLRVNGRALRFREAGRRNASPLLVPRLRSDSDLRGLAVDWRVFALDLGRGHPANTDSAVDLLRVADMLALLLLAATGPGRLALSNVMVGTGGDGTLRSTKVTCGCPS